LASDSRRRADNALFNRLAHKNADRFALAQATIDDARLRVMLTITGVNTTVAIGLLSAEAV
jgi:hypothetical protein